MSTLILFNKPYGVISQFSSQPPHQTLADFIHIPEVYPAGRLDTDSEGLLLLTDNGKLQHRIADPKHKLAKTYYAQVEGVVTEEALASLRGGVTLKEFTTQPAEAEAVVEPEWLWPRVPPIRERQSIPTSWIKLTIHEGKNRQVRRMAAKVGFPTLRLIRQAIGPWSIEALPLGQWRILNNSEIPKDYQWFL